MIGQPVRRREDLRLLTGRGRYGDDINVPGQSYAVMVRSPLWWKVSWQFPWATGALHCSESLARTCTVPVSVPDVVELTLKLTVTG